MKKVKFVLRFFAAAEKLTTFRLECKHNQPKVNIGLMLRCKL